MSTTHLPRNIFAPTVECGSAIIHTPKGPMIGFNHQLRRVGGIDKNMCFYTCVLSHISTRITAHVKKKLALEKRC